MKPLISIIMMLTIAPLIAATGLISFNPENWGGSFSFKNIFSVAIFGIATVPLWITYLPSLIIAPLFMGKISGHHLFYSMPYWKFIAMSVLFGTICGIIILSPCIIMAVSESAMLVLNWAWAGVISGAITFTLISMSYRLIGVQQ